MLKENIMKHIAIILAILLSDLWADFYGAFLGYGLGGNFRQFSPYKIANWIYY